MTSQSTVGNFDFLNCVKCIRPITFQLISLIWHLQTNKSLEVPPFISKESTCQWNARFVQHHSFLTHKNKEREMNVRLSGSSLLWRSGFSQTNPAKLRLVRQHWSVQNVNSLERGWTRLWLMFWHFSVMSESRAVSRIRDATPLSA